MESPYCIRSVRDEDVTAMVNIYKYYVDNTAITFEYEVPSAEEFLNRIRLHTTKYPWLVCVYNNEVVGYAYACDFRYRSAYQWSPECSIYVAHDAHGKGIGGALYDALFAILQLQGYYNVFGGLALPNDRSERLHTSRGFREIGVFENIGYKHGQWHTTKWFQLILQPHATAPNAPLKPEAIKTLPEMQRIFDNANKKLAQINSK